MEKLKAQWEALPQWQKLFILLFIPIAVAAYVYLMLITPLQEQLKKSKAERDALKSEIEELKRLADPRALDALKKRKEELETQLEQKKEELERVVGEIPPTKDANTIYKRVGSIARRSGVVILSATLGKPTDLSYDIEKVDGQGVVKIVRSQERPQQQQAGGSPQQPAPPSASVRYPTAELRVSFLGGYAQVVAFLIDLHKERVVSYPSSLMVNPEGDKLRGDIVIFVLMKEEKL